MTAFYLEGLGAGNTGWKTFLHQTIKELLFFYSQSFEVLLKFLLLIKKFFFLEDVKVRLRSVKYIKFNKSYLFLAKFTNTIIFLFTMTLSTFIVSSCILNKLCLRKKILEGNSTIL